MSSKRRATSQLTKDHPRGDEDDNVVEPSGEFNRADEQTLQRRIIAPLKRGRTLPAGTSSLPVQGGAFSNFSFTPKPSASSSFGPSSSTPAVAPSNAPFSNFSFSPVPVQKPIQQEPENNPKPGFSSAAPAPTASKEILSFATSLRGLNESFKAHVNERLASDPFADLSGCLERYREHHARIMETSKDAVQALKDGNKGNVQTSASSSVPAKSASVSTASKWTCDTCLIQNDADKIKCAACEADKPGAKTAPSASGGFSFSALKDAPPSASPTGGFSFKSASADAASPAGGFSFKSASADAPSTPGKSSPFASSVSQVSKWTCGTCLIQNDAESAKCAACEADKPGSKPVTPAAGGFSFSALKEPASSPSPAGGFSFNSSSAGTAPAPTNAPASTFSFGGGGGSGFSFGEAATPRPTVKGVGFSFAGATSKKAVPTFTMSENPATDTSAASSGFSFNSKAAPAASGGFSFGAASNTPQPGGFSFAPKAAEAPKPESAAVSIGPKWTCDVCMITNPDEKLKCAACEADKPKPKASKPAVSVPQWTCDVCMITNPDEKLKCAACEADKPKPKSSTSAPLSAAPKQQWICDVCMITNPDEKLKCAACEADKPGTKSSAAPPSLFGAAASPAPAAFSNAGSGGFSFAKSAATADPSGEKKTFSFGAAPAFGSSDTNAPGKFSFGAAPAKTDSGLSESSAPAPSKFSFASANSGFSFSSVSSDAPAKFGGFGSVPQPTTTGSFGGFGALNAPASQGTDSQNTNEDDDEDAPKDEQIDSAILMRGAGEEGERTVHEVRCKAYVLRKAKWDDVGLGLLKLNTHRDTGKSRLILRADGSGRVLLNLAVFEGMNMKAEPNSGGKAVGFMGVGDGGALSKYLIRVKDGSQGEKMVNEVDTLLKK
ncbi:hypothetical protein CcCBS67573_g03466 [Chytriomyces confervae]|uniref:Nuclear pore complex protein Nup153 n=1 Tax=Chytriomyces confervae TaxID=246404 RepID=A0A507FGI1_9FUNG|nr:hypothetical protein HDU80_000075 [Chytriomyces hyalinus]TPX75262.1 hypothetical protein CcCBS67573_g03466 [Chytriomyces confervae]